MIIDGSFNSTMVRLKVASYGHHGPNTESFNSTMVRLKASQSLLGQKFLNKVSIPQWFD